jgi:nitroreductase
MRASAAASCFHFCFNSSMTINPATRKLLPAITSRYSPYRFDGRPVDPESLMRCFEAAQWAASSYNEQPWRWIVASRNDPQAFEKMTGCLLEANQAWASNAGALILTLYRRNFSRNENPNRVALHDLGQASAHFSLQAASMGLQVHQMAGVNLSQVRVDYQVPEPFEPATAIAVGYPDRGEAVSESDQKWAARESSARQRNPLAEHLFTQRWGNPVDWE